MLSFAISACCLINRQLPHAYHSLLLIPLSILSPEITLVYVNTISMRYILQIYIAKQASTKSEDL